MKRVTCKIQVGNFEFLNVNDVEINSSYETLTDTATLVIPRKLQFEDKAITGDAGIFKSGDPVKIYLGYDFKNVLRFQGYLTDIKPGTPLKLHCEDEMYMLKRGSINKSYSPNVTLSKLLKDVAPNYETQAVECNLGKVRINNLTPSQLLNQLNKTYCLRTWFREKTLYCGLAYWPMIQQTPPPVFTFNQDIIKHDLTFIRKEDVRIKVTAVSIGDDNKKTEVELGDPEGDKRTLTYYNMNAADLKAAAGRELDRLRYTGFRGKFTTFGEPYVNHGDRVQLIDNTIPDRNGLYIVRQVKTTFGLNGYKQEIEIDAKV